MVDNYTVEKRVTGRFPLKPVFHSRISPPLAKNFASEKVHLFVNEIRSNS
jgi:hypothetical protein